jgi:hypothetical protein
MYALVRPEGQLSFFETSLDIFSLHFKPLFSPAVLSTYPKKSENSIVYRQVAFGVLRLTADCDSIRKAVPKAL